MEQEEKQDSRKDKGADKTNQEQASKTITVIEEQLSVGKKVIEGDTIRIKKEITEEIIDVQIPLSKEEYEIERVEINRYVDTHPEIRQEGDETIIPVVHEVIERRLILVEEVHLKKKVTQILHKDKVPLKKENITIEKRSKEEK